MSKIWSAVPTVLVHLYAVRVQIVGLLLLWPCAGWAFTSPLLRGLQDIDTRQVGSVSQLAAGQAVFLAITANLVLLWLRPRFEGQRVRVTHQPGRLLHVRRAVSAVSLLFWLGFMASVRSGSDAPYFWVAAAANMAVVVSSVVIIEEFINRRPSGTGEYRLFLLPLPGLWTDSFRWGRALFRARPRPSRAIKTPRVLWRLRRRMMRLADCVLGPGFLDYRGRRPSHLLPGVVIALVMFAVLVWTFQDASLQFRNGAAAAFKYRLIAPSPLSMTLTAALLLSAIVSFLAFYADRFRLPVTVVLLALMALATSINGVDHVFWAEPISARRLDEALTPRQVIARSPPRIVVAAAAGGGIQASGWTAQVLAGLREGETGNDFKRALRVISGVSGGAVGAVFYAGTYDGVWGPTAYSVEEARRRAMASSLDAALWGLVYPDLHRLLVPASSWAWRNEDRGSSLERAIAIKASGRSPGPTLLALAPLVRDGMPVLLLNATLTDRALPVTFSNSRYPDPHASTAGDRSIRSFHEDFGMDTRLETAARLSASFPIVSPAARPAGSKKRDAFVDGGYFDNSGLYALMGWLTEAAPEPSETHREVLILLIDSFPEAARTAEENARFSWYRQLTIPFETVVGVRTSSQLVRNRDELPLLAKWLERRLTIKPVAFRYHPDNACAGRQPPLSWHLTRAEQQCLDRAWNDPATMKSRKEVSDWLKEGR